MEAAEGAREAAKAAVVAQAGPAEQAAGEVCGMPEKHRLGVEPAQKQVVAEQVVEGPEAAVAVG